MMRVPRLGRHRSALATVGAVVAVVAVVAGVAVASGGYAAQRMDLGDASVWVVNDDLQSVGRANTAVLELNSVVETGGSTSDVLQQGATVLVLDQDRASVGIVDPTTSKITKSVAVPPEETTLALAGDRVVVASGGAVWSVPASGFGDFDSDADPSLTFGAGAVTSVDPAGVLFAYTPSTGDVARVDAADEETVAARWQVRPLDGDPDVQITSVGERWVVLDADSRRLFLDGHEVDLSEVLDTTDDPVLQLPALSGETVAIASRRGLISVDLDGGEPSVVREGMTGTPAAPIMHDGCLHAAWGRDAWRSCAPDDPGEVIPLDGAAPGGTLAFAVNGTTLVLNDRKSGRTWAAADGYALIDNWDELLATQHDEETIEQNDPETQPTIEKTQVAPIAVDDELGARPGRSTLLPVLLNDYDANGDVLVVDAIDGEMPPGARLDRVSNNQQLQLTLDDAASGTMSFGYTVGDGRGGTAHAVAAVTVRDPEENSPPLQQRENHASVEAGGRVTTAVLGDWIDPDGDPFFLESAAVDAPDRLSSTAEGIVVFDEAGGVGAGRTVGLTVSDGRDTGNGVLTVSVRAPGDVTLIAEPFVELATAGEEIKIDPLRHVRGGSGTYRLSAVPAKPDVQIVPDFDGGSFRFTSADVRTHYLEYSVTDGTQTATGLVRVDVSAPPDRDTTPITVPHTAFLRVKQPVDVDVLATDIDPTGGVLIVTGITDDAADEGVRVEVVDHRILRITLDRPLATGSTTVGYRVSNGLAEADGQVTLVEVPPPTRAQPPVAAPDTIAARTGDVIDIRVLDNDEHPDAMPFTLAPELDEKPAGGFLFASGDRLRYHAPDEAGEFQATYRIVASDGQNATATVSISVRDADPETNSAPVPPSITARVIAGEKVRIPIPLGGTDPDGDSVQLLGQESNPERGAVIGRGADWLEYQSGDYSAGTDTFQYSVVDALGERAIGSIRVGIAPKFDGARPPIAVEDVVTVRPGRTISVRVLENDSDPDGGTLSITTLEPNTEGATGEIDGDTVRVEVPDAEGEMAFVYTIQNERLGTASTFLRVVADDDAPLARPEASDTVLSLSDILDEDVVDVEVLRNVFLADGDAADLTVGLVAGYDSGAQVRRDGSIRVTVQDRRRIIPFSVSHPEDPTVVSYAFIWMPGRDDALPQLRRDAPEVEVRSGAEVVLDLDDYVIAASGRPVRIADEASVRASHSDGTELVVDEDTVRFRSETGYFGPASLSMTVTDGESGTDPAGRSGTIVIPIDVQPTEDQPPTFTGGVIDFEPGQSKTIDLVKLTTYPYPEHLDELAYRILEPRPDGFSLSLDGQELTISAAEATRTDGSRPTVSIAVRDDANEGTAGRIELRVVPSTRPLAQPAADYAVTARGRTTTIDVLANDGATNPFPGTPLRVVRVTGLDDDLPAGVRVVPSADRSTLTVDVDQRAEPINTTLQYQVADATEDPSRYAWGSVTISVQDRPDPVTQPQVTGFGDRTLDVAFGAGGFNNSPITGYEISLVDAASGEVLDTSSCAATTCTVPTQGNGQGNAVRVRIQARNDIGLSDAVEAPGPIWSDVIPPPPAGLRALPLDGRLRIEWSPVDSGGGSQVGSYVVTVGGVSSEVDAGAACTPTVCATESQGIANGTQVPFTVSARNQAYPALAAWTEAGGSGTPFGSPIAGGISVVGDAAAGTVTVSWSPFEGNGDAIGGYFVQRLADGQTGVPSGPQACSVTSPAPGQVVAPASGGSVAEVIQVGGDASSVQFSGTVTESTRYSFVVWGFNRAACVNTEVAGIVVRPAPGAVNSVQSDMSWMNEETWDRYVSSVEAGAPRLEIVAVDGNGAQLGQPTEFRGSGWLRALLNRPFGESARFQVRSCSLWGSCGPWSAIMPSSASPSLTFALPSRVWDAASKSWSWAAAPDNSGLPAAFRCGTEDGRNARNAQSANTCQVPDANEADRVWLDVEVAGVTARYWNR